MLLINGFIEFKAHFTTNDCGFVGHVSCHTAMHPKSDSPAVCKKKS